MKKRLKQFFDSEKIEYFSVIPYSMTAVTRPDIMARESFVPKSVIIFLVPYYSGDCTNISRYAAARDYHIFIRDITDKMSLFLKDELSDIKCKGYGDHSPIDERDAAAKCSLGVIGDSGLLINEKYGSYVFIAELITDAEPSLFGDFALGEVKYCEHCTACRAACPTGRLSEPKNPCLSAITQKKGELSEYEKELLQKNCTAWGCDICQMACPHNENPHTTPIKFFCEERITNLTDEVLTRMSDEEFFSRAFSWRGKKVLERNLEVLKK
jgi:epoxyqueuosine reductase QueG